MHKNKKTKTRFPLVTLDAICSFFYDYSGDKIVYQINIQRFFFSYF